MSKQEFSLSHICDMNVYTFLAATCPSHKYSSSKTYLYFSTQNRLLPIIIRYKRLFVTYRDKMSPTAKYEQIPSTISAGNCYKCNLPHSSPDITIMLSSLLLGGGPGVGVKTSSYLLGGWP